MADWVITEFRITGDQADRDAAMALFSELSDDFNDDEQLAILPLPEGEGLNLYTLDGTHAGAITLSNILPQNIVCYKACDLSPKVYI